MMSRRIVRWRHGPGMLSGKSRASGGGKSERRKLRKSWRGKGVGVVLFSGLIHTSLHVGGEGRRGFGVRNGVTWSLVHTSAAIRGLEKYATRPRRRGCVAGRHSGDWGATATPPQAWGEVTRRPIRVGRTDYTSSEVAVWLGRSCRGSDGSHSDRNRAIASER